jgi:hypothetical protein
MKIGAFSAIAFMRKLYLHPSKFLFIKSHRAIWLSLFYVMANLSLILEESPTFKETAIIFQVLL